MFLSNFRYARFWVFHCLFACIYGGTLPVIVCCVLKMCNVNYSLVMNQINLYYLTAFKESNLNGFGSMLANTNINIFLFLLVKLLHFIVIVLVWTFVMFASTYHDIQ